MVYYIYIKACKRKDDAATSIGVKIEYSNRYDCCVLREVYTTRKDMPIYDALKSLAYSAITEWGKIPDGADVQLFTNNQALASALNHQKQDEYPNYHGFQKAMNRFSEFGAFWAKNDPTFTDMDKKMRAAYNQWLKKQSAERKKELELMEKVAKQTEKEGSEAATATARLQAGRIGQTFRNLMQATQNGGTRTTEEVTTEETTDGTEQAFDQEQLEGQWFAMCIRMQNLPEMVNLAQRMKALTPTVDYPNVVVKVDNEYLLEDLSKIRLRIQSTLRRGLDNSKIVFHPGLTRAAEVQLLSKKI